MVSQQNLKKILQYNGIQEIYSNKNKKQPCRRYEFKGIIPIDVDLKTISKELKEVILNNSFEGYIFHSFSLGIGEEHDTSSLSALVTVNSKENNIFSRLSFLKDSSDSLKDYGFNYIWIILWTDIKKVTNNSSSSWRKQVIASGDCVCCGGKKKLEAHHVFSKKHYPELEGDVSNGVPLCHWCHKKYHSYYGYDNVNPDSLIKFLKEFEVK